MAKIVLNSSQRVGNCFVISGGFGQVYALITASNRGAITYDVDIRGAHGTFLTVNNNTNSNYLRTNNIGVDVPHRVTASAIGVTLQLALQGGEDSHLYFCPVLVGSARTLASNAGDVDVTPMANDFRAETAALGGIGYTVASSTARATATVDDDGTVTITSVSAGAAVITLTCTDRFGVAATNTVTVTVS